MGELRSPKRKADTEQIVENIVGTIRDLEGIDPLEMTPPLYEAIDPEALESVVESADDELQLTFTYQGYNVTVSGDGEYHIEP